LVPFETVDLREVQTELAEHLSDSLLSLWTYAPSQTLSEPLAEEMQSLRALGYID
jgi:hypothetical protein